MFSVILTNSINTFSRVDEEQVKYAIPHSLSIPFCMMVKRSGRDTKLQGTEYTWVLCLLKSNFGDGIFSLIYFY